MLRTRSESHRKETNLNTPCHDAELTRRHALCDPAVVARLDELGVVIVPDAKLTPAGLQTGQETAHCAPVIKAAGRFAD